MRLAWLSDIHLNFLTTAEAASFFAEVRAQKPDAVLLTGDVGEARSVVPWLEWMVDVMLRPIYFVLGNHDYYGGSIAGVRADVAELCRRRDWLIYLTQQNIVELTPNVGLVGDDGWADGRLGNYERSLVMMNDYRLIAELAPFSKRERLDMLHQLGDTAAAHVRRVLPQALKEYQHVVFATHVPPFRESCWHEGQLSDDEWLPHFTCKAVGDAILEIMRTTPERQLTVYCGHTHSPGIYQPLPNVVIHTSGAKYGQPSLQRVIEVE
ncbi:MAG TPA: metallophosphoesterase [Pirellulales bacterium]